MHFMLYKFILISIFYAGCSASLHRQGRMAQVRLYNESGSFQQNGGELGIYDQVISTCQVANEGYFESLQIEYIEDGCYRMSLRSPTSFKS
jgi:hypothetical protein